MKSGWRKLLALMVFLTLPLQGVAATVHALSCLNDGNPHAAHSQAHGHGHDHGSHAAPHGHDGDAGKHDSAHFCCNIFSSGMLNVPASSADAAPPIFATAIPSFVTLFVPEQPQRPPRS